MLFDTLARACREMLASAAFCCEFTVRSAEETIRIRCVDFEPSPLYFFSLGSPAVKKVSFLKPEDEPDTELETFYCFRKSSKELLSFLPSPISSEPGRYTCSCPEGRLAFSAEFGFFSLYERAGNATYIWICEDMHSIDGFISHPLHMEFSW